MQYDIIEEIGRGSYGTVYKARHTESGSIYAIKRIDLGRTSHYEKMCTVNELRILSSHKCPFIIGFKTAFVTKQMLHIVTEFASRRDLTYTISYYRDRKERIPEHEIWSIFLQTSVAIAYLHSMKIIHRDVKPANVFVDCDGNIKLGDVGIVKIMKTYMMFAQTQVGTPVYMCPELLKRERYDNTADVWSLGCILYELMTLEPAFTARNMIELRTRIVSGRVDMTKCTPYTPGMCKLVPRMICTSTRSRIHMEALFRLEHVRDHMSARKLQYFIAGRDIKALFNVPCSIPRTMHEWRNAVQVFCVLRDTVQLDGDVKQRVAAVTHARRVLRHGRSVRVATDRVLPYAMEDGAAEVERKLNEALVRVGFLRRRLDFLRERV